MKAYTATSLNVGSKWVLFMKSMYFKYPFALPLFLATRLFISKFEESELVEKGT